MGDREQPRLDSSLAQKVVDTIAPTINRNVNIMNAHGVIVASTDAARVGSHHESSAEAIARNQIVRVNQGDGSVGTQPGVNVPLTLNGQLCGVVGVTGAPHEVEPLAGLIALTVELLFTQEREHSRSVRSETEARDLLSALLSGKVSSEVVEHSLRGLGFRGACCIELWIPEALDAELPVEPALEGKRTAWVNLYGASWRLRLAAEAGEVNMDGQERFISSDPAESANDLLAEAEILRALLSYPPLIPTAKRRGIWSQEIAVAIARTPLRSMEHLALSAQELSEEQARTLLVVTTASSMSQAADDLHIHRNTLVQRLERISAVSGVDIRQATLSLKLQHAIYARVALEQLQIF